MKWLVFAVAATVGVQAGARGVAAAQGVPAVPGVAAAQGAGNGTGQEPAPSLGARDVATEFRLPPLHDGPGDALAASAATLQVLVRARALGLTAGSAMEAWTGAEETYRAARMAANTPDAGVPVVFQGTRASELNALLARGGGPTAVVVQGPELVLDVPIRVTGSDVGLDLGQARLRIPASMPYAIRIEGAANVRLRGGHLGGTAGAGGTAANSAAGWGVLVAGSRQVLLMGIEVGTSAGGGVVVTGSTAVTVWGNRLHGLGQSAVLVQGNSAQVTVAENEINEDLGSSNWQAGVVLSDRNADLAAAAGQQMEGQRWVKMQPIPERAGPPHDNIVAYNRITGNASSGVYSDGAVRSVFVGNRIERNSKEGLCLDNGSAADVVAWNVLRANGKRWGKSDDELARDFVLALGRLPDGTSPAKLPGISIDNAAYNQVMFNEVDGNFGGGIKVVRTGYFNRIGMNLLTDNNEGQSTQAHFFGVELGAARADAPVPDLDFAPSRGNQVFGNTIRGTHYAGVFFADGSDTNDVFDNAIFGATVWAMESVRVQPEMTLNNLTNLRLRNVNSGLDPALLGLGAGVMDTPAAPTGAAGPVAAH